MKRAAKRTIEKLCLLGSTAVLLMGCAHSTIHSSDAKTATADVAAEAPRDMLFNQHWMFFKGDDAKAQDPAFDDAAWRVVDLPHDWSIEGPFDSTWASCSGFLPCGIGWYRKTFTVPEQAKDQSVSIRFDGIMNHSTVWCNGKEVGGRPYGFSSFTCDLTPVIHFGGQNVIAVRVNHERYADSRWYTGSGIYRNVFLTVTDKIHVATNGTFVTTPSVTADAANARIQTTVMNETPAACDVTVINTIKDAGGAKVGSAEQSASIPANDKSDIVASIQVPHPALWSTDSPQMYSVQTQIKRNGIVVDQCTTPFGIRTFAFDPSSGFSLNGQSMKLKGVCLHEDAGALGAAVPIEVWDRRLSLLKQAGCNAIRCSHNPPAPEFLDLCDRLGFLVMDEAFDEWNKGKIKWLVQWSHGPFDRDGYHSDFDQWSDADLHDMIVRDRNHPSIVMWSIGNEIDGTNDPYPKNSPELPPIAQRLIKDVKALDTSRPVTAACAAPATNLFKKLLDVEGYNYMERLYARDHAAHPARVIYGSENGHSLQAWEAVVKNDYIAGQFLWTGIDYLGETDGWPSHGNDSGLMDLAGFPKNDYYFRQSLWSSQPMVHLSSQGTFHRDREGNRAAVEGIYCFTNCDQVELFHDGLSVGVKHHAPGEVLIWPGSFTGDWKAIGSKGSDTVTDELKKAGPPARLVLKPDVSTLPGDRCVAQVEVNVTDDQGTAVLDAANLIQCQLSGPGRILGIENGNIRSTESYQGSSHSLYQGRMLIYLQSVSSTGELKLTVSSPNVAPASVTLAVR